MNFDQIADEVELSNEDAADRARFAPPVEQGQCGECMSYFPLPMKHLHFCSDRCMEIYYLMADAYSRSEADDDWMETRL